MRLFPQPDVEDGRPRKGPVVTSTLAPNLERLRVRTFGLLRGLMVHTYTWVPFTQGASGSTGLNAGQNAN